MMNGMSQNRRLLTSQASGRLWNKDRLVFPSGGTSNTALCCELRCVGRFSHLQLGLLEGRNISAQDGLLGVKEGREVVLHSVGLALCATLGNAVGVS
jgi:hypothetical protein